MFQRRRSVLAGKLHRLAGRSQLHVAIDVPTYPYPVQAMTGTWGVEDNGDGSRIRMRFEIEPTDDDAGGQFMSLMKGAFPNVLDAILNRWQKDAESAAAQ